MTLNLIENQNQLRLANIGCDVILEIGHREFPAHRVVLMARMEYFKRTLTSNTLRKKKSTIQLDSNTIDSTYFSDVLNYIYTSQIELTKDNVRPIYKTADHFGFDELTDKVKEYMQISMNIENVNLYQTIAFEFGLKSLYDEAKHFMFRQIFAQINKDSRSKIVSSLRFEDLEEILVKLKESGRFEDMFHYSIDWILQNQATRTRMLLILMENIPMENLKLNFLVEIVSKNTLIRNDIRCLNLVLDAFITVSHSNVERLNKIHTDKLNKANNESNCRLEEMNKLQILIDKLNATIPSLRKTSLFAIGGKDGLSILSTVSEYNSTTHEWTSTTPMLSPRSDFGCAVIGHRIYVCGGIDGHQFLNTLAVFDTHIRTWSQLKPMKHRRCNAGMAAINEQIYVAGGWNGTDALNVVERYCVRTDQWSVIAPMLIRRSAPELVAFNGVLYAISGYIGRNIEQYDPQTDQWSVLNNANNKYSIFGSAVLNGYIYISKEKKGKVYSPVSQKWADMPAPRQCGYGSRLAAYNGKLYVVGGSLNSRSKESIKTMLSFDFQARAWRLEPDMDVARAYHRVAVIEN